MAITFEGEAIYEGESGAQFSVSETVTVPTDAKAYVAVFHYTTRGQAEHQIETTLGGQAMTEVAFAESGTGDSDARIRAFILHDPPTGAQTLFHDFDNAHRLGFTAYGVMADGSISLGTPATASAGSGTAHGVTLDTSEGPDKIIAGATRRGTDSGTATITAVSPASNIISGSIVEGELGTAGNGASTESPPDGASTDVDWTFSEDGIFAGFAIGVTEGGDPAPETPDGHHVTIHRPLGV